MKGLSITNLLIMLIIGVSVMIGLGNFYLTSLNAYNISPNGTTLNTFSQFNSSISGLSTNLANIQNKTAGTVSSPLFSLTQIYDVTTLFLSVGQVIFQLPSVMGSFINTMITVLSNNAVTVPSWFGTMIAMIIIIVVTFQVLRIFTRSFFEI
jgi:hypothetical protein